ncbi:hypothetical protein HDU88_006440 [Geranomyces variabilis]|nr:hypothetical protein HDU88_006440 [Geranomyces variabilis]
MANHIDSYGHDPHNPLLQLPAGIAREYPNHPHHQTWVDIIEILMVLGSASTELVKGPLAALRGVLTITQYNIQVTRYTQRLANAGSSWALVLTLRWKVGLLPRPEEAACRRARGRRGVLSDSPAGTDPFRPPLILPTVGSWSFASDYYVKLGT